MASPEERSGCTMKKKLVITFLAMSIIPLVLVGEMVFYKAKGFLKNAVLEKLRAICELKEGQIFLYLEQFKKMTDDFASDGFIRQQTAGITAKEPGFAAAARTLNVYLTESEKPLDGALFTMDVLDMRVRPKENFIQEMKWLI